MLGQKKGRCWKRKEPAAGKCMVAWCRCRSQVLYGTYSTLATEAIQRLREDFVVEQTEKIPLWTGFGLEVPEHPAISPLFEDSNLGRDIESSVVLELLTPLVDKIDVVTGTDSGALWIVPIISCTHVPAIESSCTVGHRSRPLSNDDPVSEIFSGVRR